MNYLGREVQAFTPVATDLNRLLASYNVYYQNLRSFHWNIRGKSFFDLHNLFEQYYKDATVEIDDIAERILTIGHIPDGNLETYLSKSEVTESKNRVNDDEMAHLTLNDQKTLTKLMRQVIKTAALADDEGTIDVVAAMLSQMEKKAWILHSWLKTRTESNATLNMQ